MEKKNETLGDRLKRYRKRRNMKQKALSDALKKYGISLHNTALSKIEKGHRPCSPEELHYIALVLDAKVSELDPNRPDISHIPELLDSLGMENEARKLLLQLSTDNPPLNRSFQLIKTELRRLHDRLRDTGHDHKPSPIERVNALLKDNHNFFAELEESGERVWKLLTRYQNEMNKITGLTVKPKALKEQVRGNLYTLLSQVLERGHKEGSTPKGKHYRLRVIPEEELKKEEEARRTYDRDPKRRSAGVQRTSTTPMRHFRCNERGDKPEILIPERLTLSERRFQLARAIGRLFYFDEISAVLQATGQFATVSRDEAVHLWHDRTVTGERYAWKAAFIELTNYFAATILMPALDFAQAADTLSYDIDSLGARFQVGFERISERLTTLRANHEHRKKHGLPDLIPNKEPVAFHVLWVNVSGHLKRHYSGSGLKIVPGRTCPRWSAFEALLSPGQIITRISEMEDNDQTRRFFCISKGFHASHGLGRYAVSIGCKLEEASALVYLTPHRTKESTQSGQPDPNLIGSTCIDCNRTYCQQRIAPPATSAAP